MPAISDDVSMDLRLRFLETLARTPTTTPSALSLARRAALLQSQLTQLLETGGAGESIRRFVSGYDLNEPLLRLAPVPAASEGLSVGAKLALLLESEQEVKTLERELRELQVLDERGVVGAGTLADCETMKDSMEETVGASRPVQVAYDELELRTTALLERYNEYVSTLSEVFISWNDIVSSAEETVARLEREQAHRTAVDVS